MLTRFCWAAFGELLRSIYGRAISLQLAYELIKFRRRIRDSLTSRLQDEPPIPKLFS
jgi:hypothetical protein